MQLTRVWPVVLALAWTCTATAQDDVTRVELQLGDDDVPAQVCLVDQDPSSPRAAGTLVLPASDGSAVPRGTTDLPFAVHGLPYVERRGGDHPALTPAFGALADASTGSDTVDGAPECGAVVAPTCEAIMPAVTAPTGARVLCAENVAVPEGRARVLVVRADTANAIRHARRLTVNGATVRIEWNSPISDDATTVTVVGGHYEPGSATVDATGIVRLHVRPRCTTTHLFIAHAPGPGDASGPAVVQIGETRRWCTIPPNQRAALWVARGSSAHFARGYFHAPTGEARRDPDFELAWTEETAPAELRPGVRRLAVTWKPPCEYSAPRGPARRGFCPDLQLENSDARCEATVELAQEVCAYLCTAGDQPIVLPVSTVFRHGNEEEWTDRVRADGEVLDGYVAPEQRSVAVEFEDSQHRVLQWWQLDARRRDNSDRVARVELTAAGVATRDVQLVVGQHVQLAGARCADPIRVTYYGERDFSGYFARVERYGRLVIPSPDVAVMQVSGGVMLAPTLEYVGRVAGVSTTVSPAVLVRASLRARLPERPMGNPWFGELSLSYQLDAWPYGALRANGAIGAARSAAAFDRFELEAAVVFAVARMAEVGIDAGFGFYFPLLDNDTVDAGGISMAGVAGIFARWRVNPTFGFEAGLRAMYPSIVVSHRFVGSPSGDPETKGEWTTAGALYIGARFWL